MPDETIPFIPPDTPVDLDNCAREPIHVPGRIQPRGVLLALRTGDGLVSQCSANVATVLGREVDHVLGRPLDAVLGHDAAARVLEHVAQVPDLRSRNPLTLTVSTPDGPVQMDAILHRAPVAPQQQTAEPVLVVELEPVDGPRPLGFTDTFAPVRDALARLDRASSLQDLYDVAVDEIRTLTGFDRVMLYHFDQDYNGEVVAEARREDLNAFLGLHYPASDIPAQARALYEKSWIRLIADIAYTPCPIVPTDDPATGQPLDLTYSTLRAVSPIHVEYLQNMGVGASMSISLLRDGRLWGLVACHHYSSAHAPTYAARAAAEFLGATLSARLVAQVEDDRAAAGRRAAATLAGLVAAVRDDDASLGAALTGAVSVLDLVPADGAFVLAEGRVATAGDVPDDATCREIARWVAAQGSELVVTDRLGEDGGTLADRVPGTAGLLALALPGGDAVVWLRSEVVRRVDWGGDPRNKEIALREDGSVRLSPRRSFDLWREVVRGLSDPWDQDAVETATTLRGHVVEALLLRGRRDIRAAGTLQRSLLPASLPQPDGWEVEAHYEASGGSLAGGDWYDAFVLPGDRLAVVVGDVTGHGLAAAGAMGQLRNALRALLVSTGSAARALDELDRLVRLTMPGQVATVAVATVDLTDGSVEHASAGHLPPLLVGSDGASLVPSLREPPLGVGLRRGAVGRAQVEPGGALLLYSDGLVERRTESLLDGIDRLRDVVGGGTGLSGIIAGCRDPESVDDATLVVVRRG